MSDKTKEANKEYLAKKRLSVKEQKFVQTLVSGNSQGPAQAVLDAGYLTTMKNAPSMAAQILERPRIQNAMAKAIQERYPDIPSKGAEVIFNILDNPEESSAVKLKALEYLMKLFGWAAPIKSASVNVSFKDQLALPGDDNA